jgi:serine/threonine protein kinase
MTKVFALKKRLHKLSREEFKKFLVDDAGLVLVDDWMTAENVAGNGGTNAEIVDALSSMPASWAKSDHSATALTNLQCDFLHAGNGSPLRIDRYVLLSILAEGGMGKVFIGNDLKLNRPVVIKLVKDELNADSRTFELFKREFRLMTALEHPHVARLYDGCTDGTTPYICMEYIPGLNLAELLRRNNMANKTLSVSWVVERFIPVAEALCQIHAKGVIHRDIKPSNLIIRDVSEHVMIVDFGVSRKPGLTLTRDRDMLCGSAGYAPCEQWHEPAKVTPAADVYALGVTLFELFAGKPPFDGDSAMDLLNAHCNAPRPLLKSFRADVPNEVCDFIHKMMAVECEARPSDLEVLRFLADWRNRTFSLPKQLLQNTETHLLSWLAEFTSTMESNAGGVGSFSVQAAAVSRRLGNRAVDELINLFWTAGEIIGPNSYETGPERGCGALVQMYWELNDLRRAFTIAQETLRRLPECFLLNHFAGAIARMITGTTIERQQFLREAIRYEESAQAIPIASQHKDYGASLATLAQCKHELAMLRGGNHEVKSCESLLAESLTCFGKALAHGRPALRLANFAIALRDAGQIDKALDVSREACDKEWFISECLTLKPESFVKLWWKRKKLREVELKIRIVC